MNASIRRYDEQDHEAVLSLHRLALENTGANAGDGPWDDDLNDIRREYLNNSGEFLVAEVDGQIVAMGALRQITTERGQIKRMRVTPIHQRIGLGAAILAKLEERAVKLGYRVLELAQLPQQGDEE